ncbi:MAG: glycogen synthase [Calditrichaeota bacterium]|nr:glycogen synthase [Calditrichota bacterium]
MLKIMYITGELIPYLNVGQFGDATCALPRALKSIGNEVRVIAPRYRAVRGRRAGLRDIYRLKSMSVPFGSETIPAAVKSGFIPRSHVQIYFVEQREFYDRPGIFGEDSGVYADNARRYAFLIHAGLQAELTLGWMPDIVHICGRFLTAAPFIIRRCAAFKSKLAAAKIILQMGKPEDFTSMNIPASELGFTDGEIEPFVALPQTGLECADLVLSDVECPAAKALGINVRYWQEGIDGEKWNPDADPALARNYRYEDVEAGKAANRAALQRRLGWREAEDRTPLGVMWLHSLTPETLDMVRQVKGELAELSLQWVVVGEAGPSREIAQSLNGNLAPSVATVAPTDENLLHLTLAGADMLLVPNAKMPSQPNPFAALPYGAVPIVCCDQDTHLPFKDYEPQLDDGCGFSFPAFDRRKMVEAMTRAAAYWRDRDRWIALQRRAMKTDCSWRQAARRLTELYASAPALKPTSH